MDDPAIHYNRHGFPKALGGAVAAIVSAMVLFLYSLTTPGPASPVIRLVTLILALYVLLSFRRSTVPKVPDSIERLMMWGLYSYALIMAAALILGVAVVSW